MYILRNYVFHPLPYIYINNCDKIIRKQNHETIFYYSIKSLMTYFLDKSNLEARFQDIYRAIRKNHNVEFIFPEKYYLKIRSQLRCRRAVAIMLKNHFSVYCFPTKDSFQLQILCLWNLNRYICYEEFLLKHSPFQGAAGYVFLEPGRDFS